MHFIRLVLGFRCVSFLKAACSKPQDHSIALPRPLKPASSVFPLLDEVDIEGLSTFFENGSLTTLELVNASSLFVRGEPVQVLMNLGLHPTYYPS